MKKAKKRNRLFEPPTNHLFSMGRHSTLFALILTLALVAVACGGGDDDSEGEVSTTTLSGVVTTQAGSTDTVSTTIAAITTTTPVTTSTTTTTLVLEPDLTPSSAVVLRGLGPVEIGMSVEDASAAAGLPLSALPARGVGDNCFYLTADASMAGVFFMVVDGEIARIEIEPPSLVATRSGIAVGSGVQALRDIYSDNIEQANEAVEEGEALAFVPRDDFDSEYRIYFEIEDDQVARYRVGIKPAIDWTSGCS